MTIAELENERRIPRDMMTYDRAVRKCRKISEEIFKLMSSSEPGTFSVNIDYKYKLNNILHKEIYLTVVGRKVHLEDSLALLYWILRFCLKLKKDYRSVKMEDVPREMWRILISSAQTLYPPKMTKLFNATKEQNIWVSNFRLTNETAKQLYGTKYVPILNQHDPLSWKLARTAHIGQAGVHHTF